MKIQTLVLGAVKTNCYFIINEVSKETIIVDPAYDASKIIGKLEEGNLNPVGILLTHGHFDHIMAVPELLEQYSIPIYITKEDKELSRDGILNGAYLIQSNFKLILNACTLIEDRECIELAGFVVEIIQTPGHTAGSVCYYFKDEGILIAGDTLFYKSVGRTDMPTGDGRVLLRSIEKKLMALPEDTKVYPGHGMNTTIGYEKQNNPFINADTLWD